MSTWSEPFVRREFADEPGIVGARWWHEALLHQEVVGRRTAIFGVLAGAGVVIGGFSLLAQDCNAKTAVRYEARESLQMQRTYGWNFGATDQRLFFAPTAPGFAHAQLAQMVSDLGPSNARLAPYFVPTLFQSPLATPTAELSSDPWTSHPVADELESSVTADMALAYRRGQAFASYFEDAPAQIAVIVDLPGPSSVAFAAGAAAHLSPVFAIDNWPHPRGVVPAHLTLAAAAHHQVDFTLSAANRAANAPPIFVLDRNRLAVYSDASEQFDNRHLARLPTAVNLRDLGIKYVLYISPSTWGPFELDDLNEDFVAYAAAGLTVRALGASAFVENGSDALYGGSMATAGAFWTDYPWVPREKPSADASGVDPAGKTYIPTKRQTIFTTAYPSGKGIGTVPIVIAAATGVILGAQMSRSGSWNRGSSGG